MVTPSDGVFGWAADEGGCFYYRVKLPFDQLKAAGYQASYDRRLQGAQKDNRVIVGQRVAKAGPSINWRHMANRKTNFLVYEVDDDLFNIHPSSERPYYFYTHPETVDIVTDNLAAADLVTVSTEPLAEQMRRYNPNVTVLPNCVDRSILDLPGAQLDIRGKDGNPLDFAEKGLVTVGYTSSPTHQLDFEMVRDQLVMLSQRHRSIVYVWLGEPYDLPVPTVSVGWIPDMTTYYQHINFDIGIAPLAGTTFNNSKSHIKALEYAARGIPVVASDEPPYRQFVQHGETGFLAKQPYQFGRFLRELVNEPQMRAEMGKKARELASRWTIQQHWQQWAQAYGLGDSP